MEAPISHLQISLKELPDRTKARRNELHMYDDVSSRIYSLLDVRLFTLTN